MEHLNQLVFRGEILPGHDLITVKARLAALLKLSPEQVEAVFSGKRVVLRKGLPAAEVERYVAHLEKLGVRVHAERQEPPSPVAALPSAALSPSAISSGNAIAVPTNPELALADPLVEEMNCPKCGEQQPKRTLCRSCAVDMKRFAEAQESAQREEREARLAARAEASGSGVATGGHPEECVGMLGLSFAGRLGRISYLSGALLCLALMMLSLQLWVREMNPILLLGGIFVSAFLSLRSTALRCHDRGWSGWLSLILAIPYLGWLFWLVLMLLPGDAAANRFGAPSRPAPHLAILAVIAVFGLSGVLTARHPEARAQFIAMMGGSLEKISPQAPSPVAEAVAAESATEVEIFTTTTCSECKRAKAYLRSRGIAFTERDVEFDMDARREFYARHGTGVPYLFVRGQSMVGFNEAVFERLLAG